MLASSANAAPDLTHLSLAQATSLLRTGNHDIAMAGAAVDAASADYDIAGERPSPQLSVSVNQLNLQGAGGGPLWQRPYDTILAVQQPLELGGKRRLRRAVARASLGAVVEDRQSIVRRQLASLHDAYYGLLAAQKKMELSNSDAESSRRSVLAAEKRLQAGDIAAADVARLRVEAARSENDARQAESEREQARIVLGRLLGQETSAGMLAVDDVWPAVLQPGLSARAVDDLVAAQPDTLAAQARVDSARHALELAQARATRDVSINMQYEHLPPGLRNSVGVGFSVPIFSGSHYPAELRRAEADLNAAELALDDVRSQVRSQLSAQHDALMAAASIIERFRGDVLVNAQKAAAAAEFAYSHGASGVMDLLDARRTLHAVQMDALDAEATYASNLATWNTLLSSAENQ